MPDPKRPMKNPNPNPKRPTRHAYRIVAFNTVIEFGTAVYRNAESSWERKFLGAKVPVTLWNTHFLLGRPVSEQ